jgi:hypothetical protein
VAKSEDFMMRKILIAAIPTLAVAFGNLAAANAAPQIGNGSALDQQSNDAEQGAARHSRDVVLIEAYIQLVAKSQGWVTVPPTALQSAPPPSRPVLWPNRPATETYQPSRLP